MIWYMANKVIASIARQCSRDWDYLVKGVKSKTRFHLH